MRKRVRLTEGDLHRIIKKSVNRIIRENNDGNIETAESDFYDYAERYWFEAFGYAIYNMIREGYMKVDFDMANELWMYGGNVG